MDLDFNKFMDAAFLDHIPVAGKLHDLVEITTRLGIYQGDYFLELMPEKLAAKGIHTFADLVIPTYADDPRYRYRLHVVTSDLTRGCMVVLPQDVADYGMKGG